MNAETIAKLLEYFDLKEFFEVNSPLHLAIISGIVIALLIASRLLCAVIEKKVEKLVNNWQGETVQQPQPGKSQLSSMDFELFERVMRTMRLVLYLIVLSWGFKQINLGVIYANVMRIIFVALCIWAAIRFFTAFVPFLIDLNLRRHGTTLKTSQSRSLLPIIKGVIWAIGLTFLLDNLGFHVSTIIAGLGIVGVAVGLAGQAILRDFFCYIVILLDKPFRIGDYVEVGEGKAGEVEYMSPKSTRLRNLNDDLIVCANSEMTGGILVNQGSIHEREVIINIGVAYDTPLQKIKDLPGMLGDVINSIPQCSYDRACLLGFGSSNLQFQILYFVSEQRGGIRDFMMTQSRVNMAILDKFAAENISMAYPTEHVLFTNLDKPRQTAPIINKKEPSQKGGQNAGS